MPYPVAACRPHTFPKVAGDSTAPTLSTVVISSNGTTVTLTFSEAVTANATGLSLVVTGVGRSLTYVSGSGTATVVYSASQVYLGETCTLNYTPGTIADLASNALASITGKAVTNGSTFDYTTLFSDDFNRANSSLGGVGNSWVDTSNAWKINSNAAESAGSFTSDWLSRPSGLPDNIRVTGRKKINGAMIVARADDSGKTGWGIHDTSDTTFRTIQFTGGGGFALGDTSTSPVTMAASVDFEVVTNNEMISFAYFNPADSSRYMYFSINQTDYASGTISFPPFSSNPSIDSVVIQTRPPNLYVVWAGDSISFENQWCNALRVGAGLRWGGKNISQSGWQTTWFLRDYDTQTDPLFDSFAGRKIFWIGSGTNDLRFAAPAAPLISDTTALIAKAIASGAEVGINTLLYRTDESGHGPYDTYNSWVRSNYVSLGVTYFVDWAAIPQLQDPTDTTYFRDGIHPTAAGQELLRAAAAAVLPTP